MIKPLLILLTLSVFSAMAEDVSIKAVDLKSEKANEFSLKIFMAGNLNDNPEVKIADKTLQVIIPKSHVNAKIVKKFADTVITATQADRSSVSIKAALPYSLTGKEALVNITLKDGLIDVSFPKIAVAAKKIVGRAPAVVAEVNNAEAEQLDESYLSKLVSENEKLAEANHPENAKKEVQADTDKKSDRVELTQASVQKVQAPVAPVKEEGAKSKFSLSAYIGKFIAFLSLMVLGFYGVLTLFKKGVIKKGKLGFLHSTKIVEVLSTTHVAPKRTLMMVKAHKQVFLISNTESGMQLISEINDVTGLIKTGEAEVTGSNFDTNLYSAAKTEKEFKLKEDTVAPDYTLDDMLNDNEGVGVVKTETNALKSIEKAPVKDQVRFSDQIKTKMKNMKQIHN